MSVSGPLRDGSSVGMTPKGRTTNMQDFARPSSANAPARYFEPCAATASMFLYAQGSSIVCAHHDTLTIEKRFARHSDEVLLLAVDNVSELGAGRLVVSYDAGQTAIVWDIMTGDEVARFASYEHLTCAAWMKNGNVAFGNAQGNIILFEPTTSEHLSARTIDQISVSAIAPAADCRTFAIGYQNGSLLIATLQPRFTILHNLTTSRGPSPIVTLAWHASSSRQKSDMLAVQTSDGDLRVWSVSKSYSNDEQAKVVRILKRTENYIAGPNWMSWSKNGRIIQYSESDTIAWDVRTKIVTYDPIPTLDNVRGLAVYGPGANLFTLGANNTVQQFDLNAPPMMVANVQHPANLLPPSPPISLEEHDKGQQSGNHSETESSAVSIPIHAEISESDDERRSPYARMIQAETDSDDLDRYRTTSPVSSRSRSSISISSSGSQTPGHVRNYAPSVVSHSMTENTYISSTSSMRSSQAPAYQRRERERDSYSTTSSVSMSSASQYRSRHKPSRLRHEVPRSPEVDTKVHDLFKFTRSRLHDVPYKQPFTSEQGRLTNDDLRRQMLSIIFGWNKEIEDLIHDEMSRHPQGSTTRILLSKWLGDMNADAMMANTENMTSSDWMLLALSGIGNQSSAHKLGRVYTQRLLETGDTHAAATILVGLGDYNDAIEIYISHKKYMEALILACLFFPRVWERQGAIVKAWGEWAILHGQQQLAVRCFACTGQESTEPWTSPSAVQISFPSISGAMAGDGQSPGGEILSPPLSPPAVQNLGPQRSIAKTSALKLITSFGDQSAKAKFFAGGDGGKTPLAAGVTPIAESALSPQGHGEPTTAVLRPSNRSAFNTPSSARPAHGFSRQRLPSIGEAPDANPREILTAYTSTDLSSAGLSSAGFSSYSAASDTYSTRREVQAREEMQSVRSNAASPRAAIRQSQREVFGKAEVPPSPSPQAVLALMESGRKRNGSRTRIPEGIELHLTGLRSNLLERVQSPEQSAASNSKYHWPKRRGPGSVASSVTSAASSVVSRSTHRGQHGGKSLNDYIHSLDSAQSKSRTRTSSRDGRGAARESSRSRKDRDESKDRGRGSSRNTYGVVGPKRSPTSPVPMSPEDLINLATPKDPTTEAKNEQTRRAPRDRSESRSRRGTPEIRESSKTRGVSRGASRERRARSPDMRPPPAMDTRGRTKVRDSSRTRSPTSPLPMSAGIDHFHGSSDEEEYRQALEAKENFRRRRERSSSRGGSRDPTSPAQSTRSSRQHGWDHSRDRSESRRRYTTRESREASDNRARSRPDPMPTPAPMQLVHDDNTGDLRIIKDERQLKKEAAARELEERRKSLARRHMAPSIPHPDQLSPATLRPPLSGIDLSATQSASLVLSANTYVPPSKESPMRSANNNSPMRSANNNSPSSKNQGMYATRGPMIGLPATPKAMRLVLESDSSKSASIEPVPPIPSTFAQASPPLVNLHSAQPSPNKEPKDVPPQSPVTLLPSTVYTPLPSSVYTPPPPASAQARPPIARSVSAPPEDASPREPVTLPSFTLGNAPRGHHLRKTSTGEAAYMIAGHRPSQDNNQMTQAVPAPPIIKELQHLKMPPPPPPAPLQAAARTQSTYSNKPAAVEVVTDENVKQGPAGIAVPVSETSVPIIAAPAPPHARGHSRGRSSADNSIGARITRAAERMRSASRNRPNRDNSRTRSPEVTAAPYESIPLPSSTMSNMSFQQRAEMTRSPVARQDLAKSPAEVHAANNFRTGLHQSEMI
ncbi:hypothetical protein GQ53DRAFT_634878 [Thozetella sp. PMI_491]|nr:hypothetical protein GQ53DRAFT_634878 [Thozetella sp. PMI_491]